MVSPLVVFFIYWKIAPSFLFYLLIIQIRAPIIYAINQKKKGWG